ncbi:MAG TPA: ATP-binding cassette domain-containing protein [bacterium]|nr:ATP-binding cassette domain-containing protein [bacterium]
MLDPSREPAEGDRLIQLERVDVAAGGRILLHDITWCLRAKENWGIFGGNGAGKSTFLRLVRGEIWPVPGRGRRLYAWNGTPQESPVGIRENIGHVSSELHDLYQRQEWDMPCPDAVGTGFFDTPWLYSPLTSQQRQAVKEIFQELGIEDLYNRRIGELSRGEGRKILIARALVARPRLLLLDECCGGVDVHTRRSLLDLIAQITARGTQILYASHRADEIPPVLTHALYLKQGRIQSQGSWRVDDRCHPPAHSMIPRQPETGHEKSDPPINGEFLIEIHNASVWLDGKKVLHDLCWRMRPDENWLIRGPNGSGKSTLLRLIAGEVWPAHGGAVYRFQSRGLLSREEIGRRTGVVTPVLQATYGYNLTVLEMVLSGLSSSIGLYQEVTEKDQAKAEEWLRILGISHLATRLFRGLSYGEQRKTLLARAMIHDPALLLLDEPCDGLDAESRAEFLRALDRLARERTRIVLVTHHPEDQIPAITHILEIDQGRTAAVIPVPAG